MVPGDVVVPVPVLPLVVPLLGSVVVPVPVVPLVVPLPGAVVVPAEPLGDIVVPVPVVLPGELSAPLEVPPSGEVVVPEELEVPEDVVPLEPLPGDVLVLEELLGAFVFGGFVVPAAPCADAGSVKGRLASVAAKATVQMVLGEAKNFMLLFLTLFIVSSDLVRLVD